MLVNKDSLIIVTGATGFIGSNVLQALESSGYRHIVCCDNFGSGHKWKNVAKRSLVQYILPEQIHKFLNDHNAQIAAIIHMGAISSTTERNVDAIVVNNIHLTIQLYEYCHNHHVQFIYASSAATYGDGSNGFSDNEDMNYLGKLTPLNPYGWSKHTVDKLLMSQLATDKEQSQVVGLKFFNVYGPNEYHKQDQASVIFKFYNEIQATGNVNLFKSYRECCPNGQQKRDFVFVQDCVDVILWMLDHPDVSGLFNVGTGHARSFNDVVDLVIKYSGKDATMTFIDMPDQLKDHYQYFTQADLQKLRDVGYQKPTTTLEDGIRIYINEYLKKRNTFKYEPNYI